MTTMLQCVANATIAAATGDDANILLYVVLVIIAVALVVGLALKDKFAKSDKKEDDEE